jgi:hypothetical protein
VADKADVAPQFVAGLAQRDAAQHHVAPVGFAEAGNHAHQGGFARAVGAEQGDYLTLLDGEIDAAEHTLAAKPFVDVRNGNERLSHAALRRRFLPALLRTDSGI